MILYQFAIGGKLIFVFFFFFFFCYVVEERANNLIYTLSTVIPLAIGLYNIITYDPGVWRCFDPRWGYWVRMCAFGIIE